MFVCMGEGLEVRKARQVHVGSDWPWHVSKCDGRPLKDCQQEFELEGVFARRK